jgi:membrane-associated protease RseP (regulator of RpoE activity)
MRAVLVLALSVLVVGCVYPRRSTSLSPVRNPRSAAMMDAPPDVYSLTLVDAQVRPRRPGDLHWDDDDGLPDTYVKIYRNDEELWQSETVDDDLTPGWGATLPRNLRVASTDRLRIEVWDDDGVGADPIGFFNSRGLPPNAVPDADARLLLEGGSYVTLRLGAPTAHRGLGLAEYEIQPDALEVLEVLPYSPAARAGLEPGDRIVAIGERRVDALNDAQAASAVSMAMTRDRQLTVVRGGAPERVVELDPGYVWLTM